VADGCITLAASSNDIAAKADIDTKPPAPPPNPSL
jgi:hypothetical protein